MVKGTPAFDAIAILEISGIDFRSGLSPAITTKAAFVNTKNGRTYGYTTGKSWSKQTYALLEDLRHSMEQDMCMILFEEGSTELITNGTQPAQGTGHEPGGIGEEVSSI